MGRFISWHWPATAELQLTVLGLYFKMDAERHSAPGNNIVQLLDDLRLWLYDVGTKGKNNIFKIPLTIDLHLSKLWCPLIMYNN